MKLVATFLICIALAITAGAQTQWLNDYDGTVGSAKIRMTLLSNEVGGFDRGDGFDCSYFYVAHLKDIKMRCSIAIDGTFTFQEYEEGGGVRAVFRGRFDKNEKDRAEGTWTRVGQKRGLPFRMTFTQGVASEDGNRYWQIEAGDPERFEKQVQDLRSAVIKGDKQKVAAQVKYPITVRINNRRTTIRNRTAFLKNYDLIFTKEIVANITKTVPHNMFVKSTGAMLGNGVLWFWGDGKVIAINN